MKLDPSKPPTTVDRLATADEILAAILQSPGAIELFKEEIVRRSALYPSEDVSIPELEFEMLLRDDERIHEDSTVN
jgi:hypothetical protein